MMNTETKKITIIGNSGGGKTQLARKLATQLKLSLTHVDAIQFVVTSNTVQKTARAEQNVTSTNTTSALSTPQIRPYSESIKILEEIQNQSEWIIDGYGPLDILEARLQKADQIIFIDLPLWRHYWWVTKRLIFLFGRVFSMKPASPYSRWAREELPDGCTELTWQHIKKLYKTLWQVHTKMRPEMLRILSRDSLQNKVLVIRSVKELNALVDKQS